jgi:hypothetical protein
LIRHTCRRAAAVALLLAALSLIGASPAYADGAPPPGPSAGLWVAVLGGFVVLAVAGLSVAALRRAAGRRWERAQRKGDGGGDGLE